jgi:hypothetical protein
VYALGWLGATADNMDKTLQASGISLLRSEGGGHLTPTRILDANERDSN